MITKSKNTKTYVSKTKEYGYSLIHDGMPVCSKHENLGDFAAFLKKWREKHSIEINQIWDGDKGEFRDWKFIC